MPHPKTHINQINKDQTQRTNIKSPFLLNTPWELITESFNIYTRSLMSVYYKPAMVLALGLHH